MKLKKIAALCLAGVLTLGVAACRSNNGSVASNGGSTNGGTNSGGSTNEKVTIKVVLWDYTNTAYYKIMIDAFEATHPNIKVEVVEISAAEYSDVIVVKMGAKEKYDVVFMKGLPEMSALIAGGHLQSLNERAKNLDMTKYGGSDEPLTVDGTLYGLPFRTDNNMIFFNKDLFDKAGVDYPKDGMTMAEYKALAEKMTSGTGAQKVFGTHVHTWSSNVNQYPNFAEEFHYLDTSSYPSLKRYYEMFLQMQADGTVQDYGELKTGNIHYTGVFYNQQVAMLQMGSWFVEALTGNVTPDKENYFNWGAVSMPNDKGLTFEHMIGGITPCAIGSYAQHPDEGWEFLNYICGEEGAKVVAARGIVPGWKGSSIAELFDKIHESFPNAPENLSRFVTPPKYIVEAPMDPNAKAINKVIDEMHSEIMTLSVSVDEAIATAQQKAKEAGAK